MIRRTFLAKCSEVTVEESRSKPGHVLPVGLHSLPAAAVIAAAFFQASPLRDSNDGGVILPVSWNRQAAPLQSQAPSGPRASSGNKE